MSDSAPTIVWFRADLRIADNPALHQASLGDGAIIGLFILDDETPGEWCAGGAAKWWLHHSLMALEKSLVEIGGTLILRQGNAEDVLAEVVREVNAGSVYWNRCYEPFTIKRDKSIKETLVEQGVEAKSFNGSLLFEPWTIETKAGGFYKVYTRYWFTCRDKGTPAPPLDAPTHIKKFEGNMHSEMLDDWGLLPTSPDWAAGFRERWTPGEAGAMERLDTFLDTGAEDYDNLRNFPAIPATSNLSPHLHIGDISPRQIWKITVDRLGWTKETEKFLKEVVWREFAYHVFYYLPEIPEQPMHNQFDAFPWREDTQALVAWQTGQTGYPMVDAGMRELWQTGHMHNRVRMITASFLVKHLLLPWQQGETWFWDTLVDADLAVNAFSWQWVAGCGADAAPYFRIFNPITQGQKFDSDGTYIRTYVPEIAALPNKYLHTPWAAPDDVLSDAGITLDETYPRPIVDHKMARERALEAFKLLPKNTVD